MEPRRVVLAVFGLGLLAVAAFVALRFIAALTVAVFVYYSTRPVFRALGRPKFWRLRIPRRLRAVIALSIFSVPLILLLGYTFVLLVTELRIVYEEYELAEAVGQGLATLEAFEGIEDLPEPTIDGIIEAYRAGDLDGVISLLSENLSLLADLFVGFLMSVLIVVVATYYLLVDGWRLREWLLRFDEGGVVRDYVETADEELEVVLFGNLLTVVIISVLAITVFTGYNALAPSAAEVPYPALSGALMGVASLVPAVGMKVVYVPLTAVVAANTVLTEQTELLVYAAAFLAVTVVVVDTIPDFFVRPYLSGKHTHVGMLMLAYLFGTVVFGFYGLFLAPIVLVLGLTFVYTVLPYVLGEEMTPADRRPDGERTLDDFVDDEPQEDARRADAGG